MKKGHGFKVKKRGTVGAWTHMSRAKSYGLSSPKSGWTGTAKSFDPSKHKRLILGVFVICLSLLGVGWAADPNNSLFHSVTSVNPCVTARPRAPGGSCADPTTTIWGDNPSNLNQFNSLLATYVSSPSCPGNNGPCLRLTANSTTTAVAINNATLDLSPASGKTLTFNMEWQASLNPIPQFTDWGYYLTTNPKAPLSHSYDPATDPTVVYQVKVFCDTNGGCNPTLNTARYDTEVFMLKTLGKNDTIASESGPGTNHNCPGYIAGSISADTSCFLSDSITGVTPNNNPNLAVTYLNYTGVTSNAVGSGCSVSAQVILGAGCSWILATPIGGTITSSNTQSSSQLPFFKFQSEQYYIGFYAKAGLGFQIDWTFDYGTPNPPNVVAGSMDIFTYNAGPAGTVSPTLDTGGWFGPIIQALINIGVFILQNIINFLGYVFNLIVAVIQNGLNILGNFFGWGNVGDDFVSGAHNLINLVAQSANALSWLSTGVSMILQFLTILSNEFGSWTAGVCCGSNSFFGPAATIVGFVFTLFGDIFAFGVFPIVTVDFFFYFLLVAQDGLGGFGSWWHWNKYLIFLFFSVGVTFFEVVVGGIGWLISHIPTISAHLPPKFTAMFTAQTGQGISAAPAFKAFSKVSSRVRAQGGGRPTSTTGIGFGALSNLAPDSLLLIFGGLFVFWQYLGSSISPLPNISSGLSFACAVRTCINNGVSATTPLLGLWLIVTLFLILDYVASGVGLGLANSGADQKPHLMRGPVRIPRALTRKAGTFIRQSLDTSLSSRKQLRVRPKGSLDRRLNTFFKRHNGKGRRWKA